MDYLKEYKQLPPFLRSRTLPVGEGWQEGYLDKNDPEHKAAYAKRKRATGKWQELPAWTPGKRGEWGYAISPPNGYVVVDIDDSLILSTFLRAWGLPLEEVPFYCKTPNGWHFWFKTDDQWKNAAGTTMFGKGLDLRAEGGYVVGPGCDQGRYERIGSWYDMPQLPEVLLTYLLTPASTASPPGLADGVVQEDAVIAEGQRNDTLNRILYGLIGNSPISRRGAEELAQFLNSQCSPPLPQEELDDMLKSMDVRGDCDFVPMRFPPENYKASAGYKMTLLNEALPKLDFHIRHNVRTDSPQILRKGTYEDVSDDTYRAMLHKTRANIVAGGKFRWDSKKETWTVPALTTYNWAMADVKSVIGLQQTMNRVDPFIKDYLDTLVGPDENGEPVSIWDGEDRLAGVFSEFFDTSENPPEIIELAARSVFLGALKRCLDPGAKHDEMVVLIGPEGCFKSSFFRYIVPEEKYFDDSFTFLDEDKDMVEKTMGKLLVEASEMRYLSGKNAEGAKRILSKGTDTVRLSYRANAVSYPRRFIFVGTSNSETVLPYDSSGGENSNRRFIPLKVTRKGDLTFKEMIEKCSDYRDQLWAQVWDMVRDGADGSIPPSLEPVLADHRQRYTWSPMALTAVVEWLDLTDAEDVYDYQIRQVLNLGKGVTDRDLRSTIENHGRCYRKSRAMKDGIRGWRFQMYPKANDNQEGELRLDQGGNPF